VIFLSSATRFIILIRKVGKKCGKNQSGVAEQVEPREAQNDMKYIKYKTYLNPNRYSGSIPSFSLIWMDQRGEWRGAGGEVLENQGAAHSLRWSN